MRPHPWRWALTAAVAVGVGSPAMSSAPKDGFPLSSYPMFSTNKDPSTTVDQAVGIDAQGSAEPLPPRALGTDEVLQARATISRAVRGGKAQSAALCKAVAERIANDSSFAGALGVEIRTVSYDSLDWFVRGERKPKAQRTHASCEIARKAP
jgi:hypothetical protein